MTLELGFRPDTSTVGIGRLSGEPVAGFVGFPDPVRPVDGIRSNVGVTCIQHIDTSIVVP